MQTDDGELIRRTLAGDGCAFAALVDRYRGMVYGTAFHSLGSPEDAQDAAQDVFLHAYGRLRELRDGDKLAPWLRRMTMNRCADLRRRDSKRLSAHGEEVTHPSEAMEHVTTRLLVRDALGRLSDKTRLTVILCYVSGYSHAEVARFLEVPRNTVRSHLLHAKRQLREEMMDMADEVINEGAPDPQWTRQVVEEAMRRGERALQSYEKDNAARHYDAALTALGAMAPGTEQRRLTMEALWRKGEAHSEYQGAIPLFEQSLAIAEELDDHRGQAEKLMALGGAFYNSGNGQDRRVRECYERALAIWEGLDDARGQAQCLTNLGTGRLWGDGTQGTRYFEQARALYESAHDLNGAAFCRAMLDVAAEVGADRLRAIIGYYAGCDVLLKREGVVSHPSETCHINYTWDDALARSPLRIQRVFRQCSHLRKILDARVPVGGHWEGQAFSFSQQPLRATVTVKSDHERVTVPAGVFENCLLTEQVTTESDLADSASVDSKRANREELCGVCRAWYAPGVGLVRLHVRRGDGLEAVIELDGYSVEDGSRDYLPLSIDNTWTYGWADLPPEYHAKEVYRVTGHKDDRWYLEHYAYALRRREG